MKVIFGILLIFFISCVAAKKAWLYKVLNDDFTINLDFQPCSGQTACLCYKTTEKTKNSYDSTSLQLSVLCDNSEDAFICARHKILQGPSNGTEGESALVVLTSALKDQISSKSGLQNSNLEEVNVKESIENSSIWETITTYLYNTGDKALNVASSALEILAGVLGINIGHGSVPSVEIVTVPCDTTTQSSSTTSTPTTTTTSLAK
uniref:Uncharacterized protein n=1 Tax=Panagrolaimus sp. ES5 TaxID=591445 RepID=A0AC34FF48_9BILA